MKKALKSVVVLVFCMAVITSTMMFAFAAPGKVSSLKASTITYNSVTLKWSKASSCDGYEIYQYKSSKWTKIATTTSTSYKVTSLKTGTTYKFRVRAYDKGLFRTTYGSYSSTVSAKPLPAKVTGLKVTGTSYNTVKLTWSKVSGASGYQVQQYKSGKWTTIKTTTSRSLSVSKLSIGTNYSFRVRAYRTVSGSKKYGSYSATVKGTPKLAAPTGMAVSGVTTKAAKVAWDKVTGASGYQIYSYKSKKWSSTGSNTYKSYSTLSAGTEYKVKIRAYKKVGSKTYYGNQSADYTFKTAPTKVSNLTATNIGTTSVDLSWTKATGARGYQVYLYDYATKKSKRVDVTSSTSSTVTNLEPGTRYRLAVRAYAKNESYCYGSYVYLYLYTLPEVSAGANSTATAAHITWTPVKNTTKYTLERYEPFKYSWTELSLSEATATEHIDANLDKNSSALYRITAYKDEKVIAVAQKEVSTTGISLTKGDYSVTVNWEKPEFTVNGAEGAISHYSVYKVPVQGYSSYISTVADFDIKDASATSYTFNLAPGTIQHYMIYAYPKSSDATPRSVLVAEFSAVSNELVIDSSNASKTAQLQMLVEAINRTKFDLGNVTVTQKSTVNMSTDEIIIGGAGALVAVLDPSLLKYYNVTSGEIKLTGTQAILEFMNSVADEGEETTEDEINSTETISETLSFSNGSSTVATTSGYVNLRKYIEPSSTAKNSMAYLYNEHNTAAWKNGFSSVSTTKNADGSYKITATLKAESYGTSVNETKTYYHPGFTSIFDSLNFGSTEGMNNELSKIGATKIVAEIGADGKLTSYSISTPVSMKFGTDMSGMEMSMAMSGSSKINYTFTR